MWQTAADGRYDIQNSIEEIDCRGIFRTDANGNYLIRTVRPLGYFIPLDGPVGQMVMAQKRHGKRPAHIHFLISAPGYRELVTALYLAGDEHLEDDVVFGASGDLVAEVKASDPASPIKGLPSIHFDFSLARETRGRPQAGRVGADPGADHGRQRQGDARPTARRRRRCWPRRRRRNRHPRRPVPREVGLVFRSASAGCETTGRSCATRLRRSCACSASRPAHRLHPSAGTTTRTAGRTTSAMKAPPFAYVRATSLADVFQLWARRRPRREAAGRRPEPARHPRLPPVRSRHADRHLARAGSCAASPQAGGAIRVGALTTHAELGANALIREHVPLLAEAVPLIAHPPSATAAPSAARWPSPIRPPSCPPAASRSTPPSSPAMPPASGASRRPSSSPASTPRPCADHELIAAVEFPIAEARRAQRHPRAGAPLRRLRHGRHRRQGQGHRQHASSSRALCSSASATGRCWPSAPWQPSAGKQVTARHHRRRAGRTRRRPRPARRSARQLRHETPSRPRAAGPRAQPPDRPRRRRARHEHRPRHFSHGQRRARVAPRRGAPAPRRLPARSTSA